MLRIQGISLVAERLRAALQSAAERTLEAPVWPALVDISPEWAGCAPVHAVYVEQQPPMN